MASIFLTKENIDRLQYINKDGLKIGRYNFPDFMIIGPQRTGTSWLHKNIGSHPQIYLPKEKELYFFSNLIIKDGNSTYNSDRLQWYSKKINPNIWYLIVKYIRDIRNFNTNYSVKITGESTASYAVMAEELINEIIILKPDIKIIMLVRHPVERAWSNAKRVLMRSKARRFEEIDFKEFESFYKNENQITAGMYSRTIRKWSKHVRPENIFVGLFDEIKKNPKKLLVKIFKFLGVIYDDVFVDRKLSKEVINPTNNMKIPQIHSELLNGIFKDEFNKLNQMFNLKW